MRVLIVDDNQDTVDSLRTVLELSGFEVAVAFGGVQALETARRFRPDAMLCDIGLPGLDGYYVARSLRADLALAGIKLIAVTGYGSDEDKKRARDAGFDHHFLKPVNPAQIVQVIVGHKPCP